jgi:hypothetical protein
VNLQIENTATDQVPTITGSSGATFSQVSFGANGYCNETSSSLSIQYWFYLSNAPSQTTVALTKTGTYSIDRWALILYDVANAALSSPLDTESCNGAAVNTTTNGSTSGSATPGTNGDFIAGGFAQYEGTFTAGTTVAFTSSFSNTLGWTGLGEYYIQPTAASIAAVATSSDTSTFYYTGTMVAFK